MFSTYPTCHDVCKQIFEIKIKIKSVIPGGVGIAIITTTTDGLSDKILLGNEIYGPNRGKYNLCAGHVDPEDNMCYIRACTRELYEEFKIKYNSMPGMNIIKFIMVGRTPVFICSLTNRDKSAVSTSRLYEIVKNLNRKIRLDNSDSHLGHQYKEMRDIKAFDVCSPPSDNISSFAMHIMRKMCGVTLISDK
jgi:ADP-ribose pyrophosphatase YjhB (NUDIX family)